MLPLSFIHAIRNLQASRNYSLINLLGLTLGITCTLILVKYIHFEGTTDQFHSNHERIGVCTVTTTPLSQPSLTTATLFFNMDYLAHPEVLAYSRVNPYNHSIIIENKREFYADVLVADSGFLKIFDFPIAKASPNMSLADPNCMLLSESLAKKLFGSENPLGKNLEFEGSTFTVMGILADIPQNSSIRFEAIVSFHKKRFWERSGAEFVLFHQGDGFKAFNERVAHSGREHPQFTESTLNYIPFSSIYFDADIDLERNQPFRRGNRNTLKILALITFLILGISIFNFINLYSVILIKRSKELGIKKVLGANHAYIIKTFVIENLVITSLSVFLALIMIQLLQPILTEFVGRSIQLQFPLDLILCLILAGFITLATSIYPILRYPGIDPISAIKNIHSGRRGLRIRKGMMGIQYIATISLLVVSIFFIQQLNFMLNKDLGFNKKNILQAQFFFGIPSPRYFAEGDEEARQETYKQKREAQKQKMRFTENEIRSNPFIQHISYGSTPLSPHSAPWKLKGEGEQYHSTNGLTVTPHFEELYGLTLTEGRFFNRKLDKSREGKVVINEAAKKFFGLETIEGSFLQNRYWESDGGFEIIGVVKDFHYQHLSQSIDPLVMYFHDDRYSYMMHITEGKEAEALTFLEKLFKEANPGKEFNFTFMDDRIAKMYAEDQRIVRIYTAFTLIALLISSLGLFGISLYDVEQRVKEIGIRKVSGASTQQIIQLLTTDFLKLIAVAFLVASPIAWYIIQRYLENFANKAPIELSLFIFAGAATFCIAFFTLIWHSYRAANSNPVNALRYE